MLSNQQAYIRNMYGHFLHRLLFYLKKNVETFLCMYYCHSIPTLVLGGDSLQDLQGCHLAKLMLQDTYGSCHLANG